MPIRSKSLRRSLLLCLILWLAQPVAAGAGSVQAADLRAQSDYLAALEHYSRQNRTALAKDVQTLRGSDYQAWAEYLNLTLSIKQNEERSAVNEFLAREAGSYLAEKLRGDLLRQLGKSGNWAEVLTEYPRLIQFDQELHCYYLQARLFAHQDESALNEAAPLWLKLVNTPESCLPLFKMLAADPRRLDADARWLRLRLLLENNRLTALKQTLAWLPGKEFPTWAAIKQAIDRPARYLAHLPGNFAVNRSGRELALAAVLRLAGSDAEAAAGQWQRIAGKYGAADCAWGWGRLAKLAAQQQLPQALAWFAQATVGDPSASASLMPWKVRAALRAGNWPQVAAAINAMSPLDAAEPAWIYWQARALAQLGRPLEARALYQRISGQFNFYGLLAANELGISFTPLPPAPPVTPAELLAISRQPDIARALALLRAEQRDEGVREWSWALRELDDRQLLAAADLARSNEILDRSIAAAERTRNEHDFQLRFPAPYRDLVDKHARELELDSAWVYGLMRQESRFVSLANSSAGAKGLMQVMPATARWVAKKIGMSHYHPSRVRDVEINIALGENYLKMALTLLGNQPLLASAAYNAGPNRARRWLNNAPLEGAIYVECIPFNETRDYVKKVMSNTVYYAALFERKPQSLKARLGTVSAAALSLAKSDLP